MIDVSHLTVTYPDGSCALEDITFSIPSGECVALLGANGAGKSTLLLTLMGILPANSGAITIDSIPLNKKTLPRLRQQAGLIFQNPDDQLFMATVQEDIAFGLRGKLPESQIPEEVSKVLERFGIAHLAEKLTHRLSGGEKRMAALAGILSTRPPVLLFDEPTSFLDPRARRQFMQQAASLSQTRLIATHDLDMALALCSRVLLLDHGRCIADGNAKEILSDRALLEDAGLELPLSLSGPLIYS